MPPGGPLGALLAQLLWLRGIDTTTAADAFLDPTLAHGLRPPSLLPGLDAAAERVADVLAGGGAVGVTGTASVGAIVAAAAIRGWVATPTGSTTSIHVERDHLMLDGARVDGVPLGLGVAGAAFYVLIALRRELRARGQTTADPRAQLDLAALGTLADGTALRNEARVLVALGLRAVHETPRPGLAALLDTALVARPTARAVTTRILPRLAAGTIDDVMALLATTSAEEGARLAARIELDAARAHARPADDPPNTDAVVVDAEWSLAEVNARTMLALGRLEPHGPGNPEPVLVARGARLDGARLAGDPMRPYWRLRLRQDSRTMRAVAQRLPGEEIAVGRLYDVAYSPRTAHVRGGGAFEIVVHDLHEHTPLATGQASETTGQKTLS